MMIGRYVVALSMAVAMVVAGCARQEEDSAGEAATPGFTAPSADPVAVPAPWWNDEVFYEVFVRSFSDSDGDGIGDIRGLIDRLDYLNDGDPATRDDLGVTALWLMPIAQSPSYHGYDTTDYYTVEEDYGSNEDFKALVAAAHDRGIEVIVDLMLNHTSSEHPWFLDSASSPGSGRRDWYVWSDTDPGTRTEWGAPAWHASGDDYYFGLFWEGMPDLNYRTPEVTAQMYDVARFWVEDMGADGFRLDAVRHLIEEGDQFAGTQPTHDWLVAWDDHIDGLDPAALTVGEVWDATSQVAPYVTDDQVDIAFEFALAEGIMSSVNAGDPSAFARALSTVLAAYPPGQFAPFLTNHDQNRVMTQFGGDQAKAKLAASALLTLPGVPFLYYGEEIGMVGQKPDELIRTPMQWDSSEGAGFTTGAPWQPVNDDYSTVNVAAQAGAPDSLLTHYRTLLGIRADHAALSLGGLQVLESSCSNVHAALRTTADGSESVLVLLNFDTAEATGCSLSADSSALPEGSSEATELLTGQAAEPLAVGSGGALDGVVTIESLGPRQAAILDLVPAS